MLKSVSGNSQAYTNGWTLRLISQWQLMTMTCLNLPSGSELHEINARDHAMEYWTDMCLSHCTNTSVQYDSSVISFHLPPERPLQLGVKEKCLVHLVLALLHKEPFIEWVNCIEEAIFTTVFSSSSKRYLPASACRCTMQWNTMQMQWGASSFKSC